MTEKKRSNVQRDVELLHTILTDIARMYTFRDKDIVCRGELTLSQCYALHTLREAGPMSLNDLASYLNLEKSSVSRMARKLLDEGLITRSENPDDFRKISLEISTKGKKVYKRIEREIMDEESDVFGDLNTSERKTAIAILSRIATMLADRSGHKCLRSSTTKDKSF